MSKMETKKKFTLDVGWAFVASTIPLIIGFLLRILFGNYLGATGLGLYSLILIIYSIATLIGALGIPTATVRYVAGLKDKPNKLNSFISCSLINSLFFGIISLIVLYFLSNYISIFFHKPDLTSLIQIVSIGVPFFILSNTIFSLFNGLRKMGFYSFGIIFRSVLILIFSLLFIFLNLGIKGPVLAIVISEIMTTIFVFILSKNIFSFILKDYLKETKQLIRFGIQLVLNNGTYFLDTNVDTIIVGYFLTSQEVGIYSIAIMFAQLLFVIPGAIAQVTYPVLTELYNKKLKSAMKSTLSKSIKYSFFITSILGLALILFSSNIISILLPPVFQEAVIPLNIIIFSLILYAPFTSIGSLWNAVGKPHIVSIFGITWVTINAAVNVALIPILGILGAAIATSTTYIIRPFPAVYLWKRLLNIDIDQWWYVKSWGILGLLVIIFFYFKSYINADLLKIIIFLVWIGCLSQLLISKEEKQEIIELIKHLFKNLNF